MECDYKSKTTVYTASAIKTKQGEIQTPNKCIRLSLQRKTSAFTDVSASCVFWPEDDPVATQRHNSTV